MKERPMIFSAESVLAILAGRKTQTRRVVTFRKPFHHPDNWPHHMQLPDGTHMWSNAPIESARFPPGYLDGDGMACPYGVPGDRLWVRETWNHSHSAGELGGREIYYKADGGDGYFGEWISPIYMPRWASRLTLEVVNVRVERLQDITPDDAYCEGVQPIITAAEPSCLTPYRELWDKLNVKRGYPWASNPWVWVVAFKAVTQ